MSNKFYQPKNEYGDLLIGTKKTINLIEAAEERLDERINIVEENHAKDKADIESSITGVKDDIHNLNTIHIKEIEGYENIDDYFRSRLDTTSEEELKIELGQTIYLLKNKEGAEAGIEHSYEEYVYQYASNTDVKIDKNMPPKMIRLGAVDTILAYNNRYGSVQLVHDIYKTFEENNKALIDEYYEEGVMGSVDYHTPKKGKAVAPCALLAFYNHIQENKSECEAIRKDFVKADDDRTTELNSRIDEVENVITERLNAVENELKTSDVEEEIDYGKSRLDRIEAAIGINHHHCDNCGCDHTHCTCEGDKCSCSDAENKCTIYCRLNDIEGDLEEHMNILEEHGERLENLEEITSLHEQEINKLKDEDSRLDGKIDSNAERIDEANTNIQAVEGRLTAEEARSRTVDNQLRTLIDEEVSRLDAKIDGNVERLDGRINEANINIASNKAYIQSVEEKLMAEETRSKAVDRQLRNDIDEEVEIRCELSDYVHHVLTENVNENINEINKHSTSLEGHESLLNIHETKLTTLHSDLSEANKEIARQYEELTNEDSRLDTSIKKNETAINSINKDITERIDRELTSLQIQTTSNTDAISTLKEVDSDIKNTISEEKNKVVNAQRDISINSAKIDAVEGRLNAAENNIAANTSSIAAHEERISNNNGSIIALNVRVTSLEDTKATTVALTATNTKVEANSTKLSDHDERISDNEESISSLDTSVKNLDAQITSKISEVNSSIDEVNSSISSNVATLEGKITESNNKIIALQTTVESNKTAADSTTSSLYNRIQLLEANVGTKNDDTTVREHITSLLAASADIIGQVDAVDKKVDKNTEAIDALETQTAKVESDIKTRVDSQTQFIVITSLDAETGIKSIPLSKLFEDEAGSSSEWTIVAVTSVAKVNEDNTLEVIYPEIKYVGADNTEHNGKDEREIQVSFNSGKSETVQIAISAFKESNKRVKNIA